MANFAWYIKRLKAMNMAEVFWRIQQSFIKKIEYFTIYKKHLPVYSDNFLFSKNRGLKSEYKYFKISSFYNQELSSELDIFNGAFLYTKYKTNWAAGFQTDNSWPTNTFSYKIPCSGRSDIGDIRTNWELNRHYQFSMLAKNYYLSGDEKYYNELVFLFKDWNHCNYFLHGVEWTSPMEIAIRVNSWIYTYVFLMKAEEKYGDNSDNPIINQLVNGIYVMADYIRKHLSRYSSANNHLIIELYAITLAGLFFNKKEWLSYSVVKLTDELKLQNYDDGVNKEMSLHYQCFEMEAYGLIMLLFQNNDMKIPEIWTHYLIQMSKFVANSCGNSGELIIFGDNDEGKIVNFSGKNYDYYHYILQLMSIVLPERFCEFDDINENLLLLVNDERIKNTKGKVLYIPENINSFLKGGYTFYRDDKVFLAIDHAPLGFGEIAAHGHADALSFQLNIYGIPIFIDSGTYNYHVTKEDRNSFRSTNMHNTVSINGCNQSEMLGPFLWGHKAQCFVEKYPSDSEFVLDAYHNGYFPVIHHRKFNYDGSGCLIIEDTLTENSDGTFHFILSPSIQIVDISKKELVLSYAQKNIYVNFSDGISSISKQQIDVSLEYNKKIKTYRIDVDFRANMKTKIDLSKF